VKWLLESPFVALDTESTGTDVETDHIVTACIATITPNQHPQVRSWLAAVDIDIPAEATQVHGITTEHAREHGRPPAEVLDQIGTELAVAGRGDVPLVLCNAAFDLTLIDRNVRRYGLATPWPNIVPHPVLDIQVLDKFLDPYRKGVRRLSDPDGGLVEWFGVRMDGAHDSTFDALATARVAWRIAAMTQWSHEALTAFYADSPRHTKGYRFKPEEIADRFKDLALTTPGRLHELQVGWRAAQQRSLREYFVSQGREASDISEQWPMVSFKEEQ
jgi:DNA polymerase III, epsilon subunit and related 3''-5'' exonucleases